MVIFPLALDEVISLSRTLVKSQQQQIYNSPRGSWKKKVFYAPFWSETCLSLIWNWVVAPVPDLQLSARGFIWSHQLCFYPLPISMSNLTSYVPVDSQ